MSYYDGRKAAGFSQGGRSKGVSCCPWMLWLAGTTAALAQFPQPQTPPVGANFGTGFGNSFPPITAPPLSSPSGASGATTDYGALYDVALTRDLPYIPPVSRPQRDYNLKFGNTTMRFGGNLMTAYSDNALQGASNSQQDDISITPALNIGIDAPVSENHSFRIDVGVGYRYSVNFSELNSLYIAPRSVIDYRILVGDVMITFYDQLSTMADTLQRVDLQNRGTVAGVDFNRLFNQAGLSAAYSLSRETSFVAGYSFGIDRGLNDAYSYFDSNTHSFNAAVYHRLGRQITVGMASSYNITEFQKSTTALSNSDGWSVGPVVSYRPSSALNFSASVRYTSISYERIGGVFAASNPATVTFDISASHEINRYLSHQLSAGRFFNNSLSSAQMETYSATYGIVWRAFRNGAISANVAWQNFTQSGNVLTQLFPSRAAAVAALTGLPESDGTLITPAEAGAIYDFYSFQDSGDSVSAGIGASYQFNRRMTGSLNYSHSIRTSKGLSSGQNVLLPEFSANVVSLNLSYQF